MANVNVKVSGWATGVAVYNVAWLAFLVLVLLSYWQLGPLGGVGSWQKVYAKDPLGGLVPLMIPWAGALGGVAISLTGAAVHTKDWDTTWNIWHFLRPVLGALSGTIGFIILVVVLRTAGGLDEKAEVMPDDFLSRGLFLIIAFVTGFRDQMFLDLVAKVVKMLLSNGEAGDAASAPFALDKSEVDFGTVGIGTSPPTVPVRIVRADQSGATGLPAGRYAVAYADGTSSPPTQGSFTVSAAPTPASSLDFPDLAVDFQPRAAGPIEATLNVTFGARTKSVPLKAIVA